MIAFLVNYPSSNTYISPLSAKYALLDFIEEHSLESLVLDDSIKQKIAKAINSDETNQKELQEIYDNRQFFSYAMHYLLPFVKKPYKSPSLP